MHPRSRKDGRTETLGGSRLHTVPDVAEIYRISKRSVWRLLAAKELDAVRLGRSVRITAESVQALLARGGTA